MTSVGRRVLAGRASSMFLRWERAPSQYATNPEVATTSNTPHRAFSTDTTANAAHSNPTPGTATIIAQRTDGFRGSALTSSLPTASEPVRHYRSTSRPRCWHPRCPPRPTRRAGPIHPVPLRRTRQPHQRRSTRRQLVLGFLSSFPAASPRGRSDHLHQPSPSHSPLGQSRALHAWRRSRIVGIDRMINPVNAAKPTAESTQYAGPIINVIGAIAKPLEEAAENQPPMPHALTLFQVVAFYDGNSLPRPPPRRRTCGGCGKHQTQRRKPAMVEVRLVHTNTD